MAHGWKGLARAKLTVALSAAAALALANCGDDAFDHHDDPTLANVEFADDVFVTVGSNFSIANSADGFDFFEQSDDGPGLLLTVTFGDGLWVAAGDEGVVLTSTD